jgi:hypothetical protein
MGCDVWLKNGSGFGAESSEFRVQSSEFRVQGFRVQSSGFRVQSSDFLFAICDLRFAIFQNSPTSEFLLVLYDLDWHDHPKNDKE